MRRWLVCVLLLASASGQSFLGVSPLAKFSREANATVLLYFNNENYITLFAGGRPVALALDSRLWAGESCCAHRATPSLSHDRKRVALVHLKSVRPRQEAVSVVELATGAAKDVFTAPAIWGVSWSPADDHVAVIADAPPQQGHNIYVIEMKSGASRQLSHGPVAFDGVSYLVSDYVPPSWSPAGTKLAVEIRRIGPGAGNSSAGAIAVWDLQSERAVKVAEGVEPSWSPAGERIAFFDPSRKKCFVIKPDGAGRKVLFSATRGLLGLGGRAPLFYPVVWSPDGSSLIFHEWSDADLIAEVYKFDLAKAKARRLGRSELQVVNWR